MVDVLQLVCNGLQLTPCPCAAHVARLLHAARKNVLANDPNSVFANTEPRDS
eukprot:m.85395 g.85395  ORF g.85395 m.85395 type:complete len:52 (-) comp14844_c0_seq1:133-288(-)